MTANAGQCRSRGEADLAYTQGLTDWVAAAPVSPIRSAKRKQENQAAGSIWVDVDQVRCRLQRSRHLDLLAVKPLHLALRVQPVVHTRI